MFSEHSSGEISRATLVAFYSRSRMSTWDSTHHRCGYLQSLSTTWSAVFVAATVISVKPPWKTQLVDFHLRFSRGLCEHTVHQDSRVGWQCLRILRIPRHWALRRTLLLLFCPHGSTPPPFIPMLQTFKKKSNLHRVKNFHFILGIWGKPKSPAFSFDCLFNPIPI